MVHYTYKFKYEVQAMSLQNEKRSRVRLFIERNKLLHLNDKNM